jgi:fructokinase
MWDVACFGELFIDLVPKAKVDGEWLYAPSPGGAPGNVAVGVSRLGHKSLMVSRVGDEAFGKLLVDALKSNAVDTSAVTLSKSEKTGLSVVTLSDDGDRAFMFYHDKPADLHINAEDISPRFIEESRILHIGLLPLAAPQSATAQRKAMDLADAAKHPISCDVNFRPGLWADHSKMIEAGRFIISRSTIVKVSEEELLALGAGGGMDDMVQGLWHEKLQFFSVTRGSQGAVLYTPGRKFACEGFEVDAVDTTGSGDAYTASILSGVLTGGDGREPAQLVLNACAAGALAATKKGAMETLPTKSEISKLVAGQKVPVSAHPRS